jgi:hypothetical protein
VGRAVKNLTKIDKIARLTLDRLRSWGGGAVNEDLAMAISWLEQSMEANIEATSRMYILADIDWAPPKKSASISFGEDDLVQIAPKYRDKYLEVYGTEIIDDLVVAKVLPSGEIAVRHGRKTPFIVAKSHIVLRDQDVDP